MAPPYDEETKRLIQAGIIKDPSQLPPGMRKVGELVAGGGWKGMGDEIPRGMAFKGMGDKIPRGMEGVADLIESGTRRPWAVGDKRGLPRGMEKFPGPLSEAVRGREVLPTAQVPKWAQQAGSLIRSVRDTNWPTAMTEADVDPGRTKTREVYPPDRVPTDFTAERAGTPATRTPSLPSTGKFDWTGVKRDIALLTEDARRRFDEFVGGRELPFARPEGREATSPEEYMGYARPGEAKEGGPPSIWADEGFYAEGARTPEELMGDSDARYRAGMTAEQIRAAKPDYLRPGVGFMEPGEEGPAPHVPTGPQLGPGGGDEMWGGAGTPRPYPPKAEPPAAPGAAAPGAAPAADMRTDQGYVLQPGESFVGGIFGDKMEEGEAPKGLVVMSAGTYVGGTHIGAGTYRVVRDRYGNLKVPANPDQVIPIGAGPDAKFINLHTGQIYGSMNAAMEGYAPKLGKREEKKMKHTTERVVQTIASNASKFVATEKAKYAGGNPIKVKNLSKDAVDENGVPLDPTWALIDTRPGSPNRVTFLTNAPLEMIASGIKPLLDAGDYESAAQVAQGLESGQGPEALKNLIQMLYDGSPEEAAKVVDALEDLEEEAPRK